MLDTITTWAGPGDDCNTLCVQVLSSSLQIINLKSQMSYKSRLQFIGSISWVHLLGTSLDLLTYQVKFESFRWSAKRQET